MATTIKNLARGTFDTSSTTLYTNSSGGNALVTSILIANTSTTDSQTFSLLFDDVEAFSLVTIEKKSSVSVDLKQVIANTKTIKGFASTTDVKYHITGAEIA